LQFKSTIQAQGDKVRVLISAGKKSDFKGAPTFGDLGYTTDIGQMHRVLLAPRGIPADRLAKLRDSLVKLQKHKTYKRLIKAIGEQTNFVDGESYEKARPVQSETYKKLVAQLAGK
jgi:tripartite-type tricarboxylate transporter receptor subunit TctC